MAWRLADGDLLYRDIAYFNGPFSPLLNATIFRLAGIHCQALFLMNLVIAYVILIVVFFVVKRFAGLAAAFVAGCAFTGIFVFNHFLPAGIFSYVAPYSHEMTHGLLLCLLSLVALGTPLQTNRLRYGRILLSGLLGGLAFLTKPEMFVFLVAGGGGWGAGCVKSRYHVNSRPHFYNRSPANDQDTKQAVRFPIPIAVLLQALGTACLVFIVAVYFSLAQGTDFATALTDISGGWSHIGNAAVTSNPFYRFIMGTDYLLYNVGKQLLQSMALILIVTAALLFETWLAGAERRAYLLAMAVVCLGIVVALGLLQAQQMFVFQAFPIMTLVSVIVCLRFGIMNRHIDSRSDFFREALPWTLFASGLLIKNFFNPLLLGYGFVLAMPAAMLVLVMLVLIVKHIANAKWQGGRAAAAVVLGLALFDTLATASVSIRHIRLNDTPVGRGFDTMLIRSLAISKETPYIVEALRVCESTIRADQSLTVLPEGALFNYFLRRKSSVGFTNYMPIELAMYGESNIVAQLVTHSPDFILLVDRNTDSYADYFGSETYGSQILAWLKQNYREEATFGHPVNRGGDFGIVLFAREPSISNDVP
ncbi:MAG TPA: glycosyltransferase family 39 protein [Pirellulaceae bacterium]|nr:glycosyltransferase family 39 protein [Pirellulaceae bacterium]